MISIIVLAGRQPASQLIVAAWSRSAAVGWLTGGQLAISL
jgi:hypothetical protein